MLISNHLFPFAPSLTLCIAALATARRVCFTHNNSISASWSTYTSWSGCWGIHCPFWSSECTCSSLAWSSPSWHTLLSILLRMFSHFISFKTHQWCRYIHTSIHTYICEVSLHKYKNISKWNILLSATDNFGVWLVESTRGSSPPMFLSVSSHAPTTDRLWMAVPSDGNPQWFPSTSFLSVMSLRPLT